MRHHIRAFRSRAVASSAAFALAVGLGAFVAPTSSAQSFAAPQAPTGVTATVVPGGVRVSWTPAATAEPAVTNYVVHAGPGSCPVTVGANATSVVMPILRGQSTMTPQVQAVNALGYSTDAVATAPVTVTGKGTARYRNVQLLQFSDFHGAIEGSSTNLGAALMASAFANDRAASRATFTVSSGDNIGGSPVISAAFADVPTIEALNLMQLDLSTFGNHEHDKNLASLRGTIDLSDFDWTVSNYSTLRPLQGKKNGTEPYVIENRGGVKVGFVGMNTEETPELIFPGNLAYGANGKREIEISSWAAKVNTQAAAAKRAGADLVVALLHQGWEMNVAGEPKGRLIDVAKRLKGVAAIYGGHTHQTYASIINGVPVSEVRNSGQEYTRTQLCLDTRTDKVIGSAVDYITKASLEGVAENAAVAQMVASYKAKIGPILNEKIGVVAGLFPRGGTPPVERSGEAALGVLAAEALRDKYGTQLVIVNGGGLRDSLPSNGFKPTDTTLRRPSAGSTGPYDVTRGDAAAVLPFGNFAATTTITGAKLWQALENGVSGWPSEGRFPQIAGFKFSFDPTRPVGSRIVSVTLPDGTPIAKDDKSYTITTLDFMVYGGDGYGDVFSPQTSIIRDLYLDVFIERLQRDLAQGVVTAVPAPDGRITRVTQ